MKWLIYGSNGWIGKQFISFVPSGITVIEGKSRVDDAKGVEEEIIKHIPNRIISFIGRTSGGNFTTIDYLEQPGKLVENVRDNLYGPVLLASLADRYNIHFTYLGTGCIFSYENESDKPFNENDLPNFFGSSYSTVKGFTDRLMHDCFGDNTLNVRIRMPITYDDNPKNFLSKILRYKKICSTLNSMTVLPVLFPRMIEWILDEEVGTKHLINKGAMNHNEILQLYKEIVNPDYTWNNFTENEQDSILLSKRSKNTLTTTDTRDLPSLRDCIVDIFTKNREEWKNLN